MALRNVHKDELKVIGLPEDAISEDRGLRNCGVPQLVLASLTDAAYYKNDRTSLAYKFDEMTVELEKDGVTIPAPGVAITFPYQSDAVGFCIDWRQVTDDGILMQGCYRVKVTWSLDGNEGFFYYGSFNLLEYSVFNAQGTVRLFVVLNDLVRKQGINFKDSGFATTIRFIGTFGNMQPNYDIENINYTDRTKRKVRIEALRTYELTSSMLLYCMTRQLDEEILLAANQIYVTDHNADNHRQDFFDFPVILSEDESPSIEYTGTIYAKVKAIFNDKVQVSESKYDGNIQGSDNVVLSLPTVVSTTEPCAPVDVYVGEALVGTYSGGTDVFVTVTQDGFEAIPEDVVVTGNDINIVLADTPDTTIEVNGVSEGSVVSGATVDIQLSDSGGTVTPTSVTQVGNDFQIVLPDAVAPTGWQRPTGWLALDTVNVGTQNFSGLFAVYETQKNVNTIQITTSGVNTINWGDGTTQAVTSTVLYTKVYDYSTITSPVLVDDAGLNYKMVVVNINMTGVSILQIDRNTTATVIGNARNLGWLDIAVDCSTMTTFSPSGQGFSTLLQRLLIYNVGATINGAPSFVQLAALKVLKFPFDKLQSSVQTFINNFGDCRDENNLPLNVNLSINTASGFGFMNNSHLTELGNITAPLTNSFQNFFFNSVLLKKVGSINASSAGNLVAAFSQCVKLTGVINVITSPILTSINAVLGGCFLVDGLIISDCTNVTNTVNAVVNCKNLKTLILTGLTRGITVDDCLMEATEINAFFTSLGTAVGSQTIFIRRNPGSATCNTTIATAKGFTVVI